jgi:uncharacterized membrane protein
MLPNSKFFFDSRHILINNVYKIIKMACSQIKSRVVFVLFLLVALSECTLNSKMQSTISLATLLHEMINKDSLTRYPDPEFKLIQSSSWDRSEKNKKDKTAWFAKKNGNNRCIPLWY